MDIQQIAFDDDGKPSLVTALLSIDDAALIATLCGTFSPAEITKRLGANIGSNFADSDVWDALVGMVFNRYWDDGLHGFLKGEDG